MVEATAQILTVTLNPALDVGTSTDGVISGHKMRCDTSRLDPGGGGVNVSRVVRRLGGRSLAIYTAGGPIGEAYRRLIDAEHVPSLVVPIRGSTRQSLTVDERSSGKQYRFVLEGPELLEEEWRACLDFTSQAVTTNGYIVASGSLPPGAPDDFYAQIARLAKVSGALCIVDAAGSALAEALKEGVFLVKPSRRELETYCGAALESEESQAEVAAEIVSSGRAQYVALTLGEAGALLATESGIIRLSSPPVRAVSTVGAGDSFLAAFVLRLAQKRSVSEAFCAGVAAGSAAVMSPATALCSRDDVERLEVEVAKNLAR